MKTLKIFIFIFLISIPTLTKAQISIPGVVSAKIVEGKNYADISWKNPTNSDFSKVILFKSNFSIEDYLTFEAVNGGLCEKIYEGQDEFFQATGLAENLPYYFIIFTQDKDGNYSKAQVLEKRVIKKTPSKTEDKTQIENNNQGNQYSSKQEDLRGKSRAVVNEVTLTEAGRVYNFNQLNKDSILSNESRRLSLFIIVKSPHDLSDNDKRAITYFINSGTPTTILLGSGERAGVLNSYLSAFKKLPRSLLEWQDVIKIANGRWPTQKSPDAEDRAANEYFNAIYERAPDMNNPNDNAAVTVIAYGLRPADRNIESEKTAIKIFYNIFDKNPVEAGEWDLVRAIAYSGATR